MPWPQPSQNKQDIEPKKYKKTTPKKGRHQPESKNEWDIQRKQSDLSILLEIQKGSKIKKRKIEQVNKCYKIKNVVDMVTAEELLKQQIQAKA